MYVVCGVQGNMKLYAFVGARLSLGDAQRDADGYELRYGKPGVVLQIRPHGDTLEVYRSPLGVKRAASAEKRYARLAKSDPRRKTRSAARGRRSR